MTITTTKTITTTTTKTATTKTATTTTVTTTTTTIRFPRQLVIADQDLYGLKDYVVFVDKIRNTTQGVLNVSA